MQIVYFCKADLNMANDIDIRNGDIVLSTVMGISHKRMQNLSKLQYSFCCSPSGCLLSRVAVNSQGAAIGENMLRHFVPSSVAELFSGGQGVQGSGRNFLLQYSFCCSPLGCLPSRMAVNSQGTAIGENLLRHSVPLGCAIQRLQGFGRYSLLHCRRIVPTDTSFMSLQGSDRYSLRQGRRIAPTDTPFESLQGSDRYFLRQSRRIAPANASSMSLKGSDKYSPAA